MFKRLITFLLLVSMPCWAASWPPNFSIVVIPDYQYISSNAQTSQFTSIVNWISANQSTYNIQAIVNTGDSVDTPNTTQWNEWTTNFLTPLMALNIPVLTVPGNHDYDPCTGSTTANPGSRGLTTFTSNVLTTMQGQSQYQANWSPGYTALYNVQICSAGSGQTPGTYSVTGSGGSCTTEPVISVTVASGGTVTAQPTITTPGSCTGTTVPTFTLTGAGGTAATFEGTLVGSDSPAAYWIKINDAGYSFGFISLGFCPLSQEVSWASGVMTANSSFPFAVATHAYVYAAGATQASPNPTLSTVSTSYSCSSTGVDGVNDSSAEAGTGIWSGIEGNANLFAVMNGHFVINSPPVFTATLLQTGTNGNDVDAFYFNHQEDSTADGSTYCSSYGGYCNAYIELLQVQPGLGQIVRTTFNPYIGITLTDVQNSFYAPYNMPGSGLQVTAARPVF